MTYCLECGEECSFETENDSFDYEYGSISGTHNTGNYYVSDCHGAPVVNDEPPVFGECKVCKTEMLECKCYNEELDNIVGKEYQEQYESFCESVEEDNFIEPDDYDDYDRYNGRYDP